MWVNPSSSNLGNIDIDIDRQAQVCVCKRAEVGRESEPTAGEMGDLWVHVLIEVEGGGGALQVSDIRRDRYVGLGLTRGGLHEGPRGLAVDGTRAAKLRGPLRQTHKKFDRRLDKAHTRLQAPGHRQ